MVSDKRLVTYGGTMSHSVYGDHLVTHGDGVKDISLSVEDCRALFQVCILHYSCHHIAAAADGGVESCCSRG